ncbi:MAG: hypothetical protein QOE35_114 [Actinomycetota bacterium]|jgi:prepilin-type N-terminal cleavage/methylation domain-containing protein
MTTPVRTGDESGFSLVELVVTVSLLGLVLATLFGALDVFTRRTTQTQERSLMLSEARSAVEVITRDIRAANPINPVATVADLPTYDTSVSFSVYCANAGTGSCGSSNLRPTAYTVTGNQLQQTIGSTTKTILGPRGSTSIPVASRQGAIVNSSAQPVFTYFKRDGSQLLTSSSGATPEKFRDCAQYVEIHLVVVAEPAKPTSTINLVTRADLRNFNQVTAC